MAALLQPTRFSGREGPALTQARRASEPQAARQGEGFVDSWHKTRAAEATLPASAAADC